MKKSVLFVAFDYGKSFETLNDSEKNMFFLLLEEIRKGKELDYIFFSLFYGIGRNEKKYSYLFENIAFEVKNENENENKKDFEKYLCNIRETNSILTNYEKIVFEKSFSIDEEIVISDNKMSFAPTMYSKCNQVKFVTEDFKNNEIQCYPIFIGFGETELRLVEERLAEIGCTEKTCEIIRFFDFCALMEDLENVLFQNTFQESNQSSNDETVLNEDLLPWDEPVRSIENSNEIYAPPSSFAYIKKKKYKPNGKKYNGVIEDQHWIGNEKLPF